LGIPTTVLNGKHQPCPLKGCGGRDRFRFTDKDGSGGFICSVCGAGDGLSLLMKYHGWDFKTAAAKVDEIAGGIDPVKPREWSQSDKKKAIDRLWRSGRPVHPRDPVGRYLINRVGITTFSYSLRTALGVKHREGGVYPCMLALLTGTDGEPVMVHRTYLTEDGQKAPVEKQKMFMPGHIPDGSAVRLGPVCDILGLSEGIETALSVTKLFGVTCWATCSTGFMVKFRPPAEVKKLIIFGDLDRNYSGHAAAYTLAHRIYDSVEVEVMFPSAFGDFNNALNGDIPCRGQVISKSNDWVTPS
jgi:putative DNA primase/helicase